MYCVGRGRREEQIANEFSTLTTSEMECTNVFFQSHVIKTVHTRTVITCTGKLRLQKMQNVADFDALFINRLLTVNRNYAHPCYRPCK